MYLRSQLMAQTDPELWAAIQAENQRQEHHIELIASENYASPAVMQAQGTQLTNKYAEGYPGKRYYGGCDIAAKAVAFKEALDPSFKVYQQQVLKNAEVVAQTLTERGLRIVSGGTPAMTTRGFKDEEARATAHLIADVLEHPSDEAHTAAVRAEVHALTSRFPVYG